MIAIVDYGAGNLRSVAKAIEKLGYSPEVTGDPKKVLGAKAVILPGVGASDSAMTALEDRGLVEPIRKVIRRRRALFWRVSGVAAAVGVVGGGLDGMPGGSARQGQEDSRTA